MTDYQLRKEQSGVLIYHYTMSLCEPYLFHFTHRSTCAIRSQDTCIVDLKASTMTSAPSTSPLQSVQRVRQSSRRQTLTSFSTAPPTCALTSTAPARDYLPFNFGFETEVILRPKNIANLEPGMEIPDSSAAPRETRRFNFALLQTVANVLSAAGMPAEPFTPDDGDSPNYSKWTVTTDSSVSKAHIQDGFCMPIYPPAYILHTNHPFKTLSRSCPLSCLPTISGQVP